MHLDGERTWSSRLTAEELAHNRLAPFTSSVGQNLATASAIMSLLPPPPLRVLDAGCSDGALTHMLSLRGYEVTGVDVCLNEILFADRTSVNWRGKHSCPIFLACDFDEMTGEYDAIVFANSLHHSRDRLLTMHTAYRCLTSGGVLVAVEPGLGHGWTKVSKTWSAQMDVTERSCPPIAVAWAGWQAGFRRIQVYPNPVTIATVLYGRGGHVRENAFSRFFRRMPGSVLLLTTFKWLHGVTVMQKP